MSSIRTSSVPVCGHRIPGSLLPSKENSPKQHTSPRFTCPSDVSLPNILFSHAHLASAALIYSFLTCSTCLASLYLFICFFHEDRRIKRRLLWHLFFCSGNSALLWHRWLKIPFVLHCSHKRYLHFPAFGQLPYRLPCFEQEVGLLSLASERKKTTVDIRRNLHGEARSEHRYTFPREVLQVLFLFNHDMEKLLEVLRLWISGLPTGRRLEDLIGFFHLWPLQVEEMELCLTGQTTWELACRRAHLTSLTSPLHPESAQLWTTCRHCLHWHERQNSANY